MSVFAKHTARTIPVPHDSPHTITIRKLTGRELDKAEQAHLEAFVNGRSSRGWVQAYSAQLAKGLGNDADTLKVLADPLKGLDRFAVVQAGLTGWSYEAKVGAEAIDELDDETVEFIAVEVMKLTRPALFQTPAEQEADEKNG